MTNNKSYRFYLSILRKTVIAVGGAMIATAIFADTLGLDHSPTLGTGEILFLLLGSVLILWGDTYCLLMIDKKL
jgi:hypothetical protein